MNDDRSARRPIAARNTRWASAIARKLADRGIKPNYISLMSVVFAVASGVCMFWTPWASNGWKIVLLLGAAVMIQMRLLCNLFDGMVAIEGGFKTKSGEIYNDMPDRFADPVILVCAGYSISVIPHAIELGWLSGLLAVMTAYVRVLGRSTGTEQHFLGPMAKQHRMAVMTFCLMLGAATVRFGWHESIMFGALVIIATGCVITIIRRTCRIVREMERK